LHSALVIPVQGFLAQGWKVLELPALEQMGPQQQRQCLTLGQF
jgi:hypothetical protein